MVSTNSFDDEINKSFEFLDGSTRRVVELETAFLGRGIYKPGWKWSEHVGKISGKPAARHIGFVQSGAFIVQTPDGKTCRVGPSQAFELEPNSDAWVDGDEPCIALDFQPK